MKETIQSGTGYSRNMLWDRPSFDKRSAKGILTGFVFATGVMRNCLAQQDLAWGFGQILRFALPIEAHYP